jgi:hypothetical protein
MQHTTHLSAAISYVCMAKPQKNDFCKRHACAHDGGIVYFLGFIGASIYYIQHATGFWYGVLGVLKALVWPVFLVHKLLSF